MLYDIRLHLGYDYHASAAGSRHQIRVLPLTGVNGQRLVASSLRVDPAPSERSDFEDFFGNAVTAIGYREPHDTLDIRMAARVMVDRPEPGLDMSPDLAGMLRDLRQVRSLEASAPHHYLAPSPRVSLTPEITAYARRSWPPDRPWPPWLRRSATASTRTSSTIPEATEVSTLATEAFALRRGVCQDFSHVMIAGLRGLGIPAGYVSGFLRTIPPAGKERLEGADAMHAWVRVWCGVQTGWLELDPTNAMRAGNDHIVVGYGRDYADVAPIVGVLKTSGEQDAKQAVDVIPLEEKTAA